MFHCSTNDCMYFQNYATRNPNTQCFFSHRVPKVQEKKVRQIKSQSVKADDVDSNSKSNEKDAHSWPSARQRHSHMMQNHFIARSSVIFLVALTTMATVKYVNAAVSERSLSLSHFSSSRNISFYLMMSDGHKIVCIKYFGRVHSNDTAPK